MTFSEKCFHFISNISAASITIIFKSAKKRGSFEKKNVLCQQKGKSDSFVVRRVQWWVNHLLRKTISSIPYFFLYRIEIIDIICCTLLLYIAKAKNGM